MYGEREEEGRRMDWQGGEEVKGGPAVHYDDSYDIRATTLASSVEAVQ